MKRMLMTWFAAACLLSSACARRGDLPPADASHPSIAVAEFRPGSSALIGYLLHGRGSMPRQMSADIWGQLPEPVCYLIDDAAPGFTLALAMREPAGAREVQAGFLLPAMAGEAVAIDLRRNPDEQVLYGAVALPGTIDGLRGGTWTRRVIRMGRAQHTETGGGRLSPYRLIQLLP